MGVATPLLIAGAIYAWATIAEYPRGDWHRGFRDSLFLFRGGWTWPANSIRGWWFPLWVGHAASGELMLRIGSRRTCLILKSPETEESQS